LAHSRDKAELLLSSAKTPLGLIYFLLQGDCVVAAHFGAAPRKWQSQFAGQSIHSRPPIPELSKAIKSYFDGDFKALNAIAVSISGTEFQQKVLRKMRKIKAGQMESYGNLALRSGYPRASRAVGSVCAQNAIPLIIPCHRVISSDGKLGSYAFGVEKKRWLLEFEGALK
jgi:methylated-DNA-[protein]-cysteine S-methyltransferase